VRDKIGDNKIRDKTFVPNDETRLSCMYCRACPISSPFLWKSAAGHACQSEGCEREVFDFVVHKTPSRITVKINYSELWKEIVGLLSPISAAYGDYGPTTFSDEVCTIDWFQLLDSRAAIGERVQHLSQYGPDRLRYSGLQLLNDFLSDWDVFKSFAGQQFGQERLSSGLGATFRKQRFGHVLAAMETCDEPPILQQEEATPHPLLAN
jgi:hypothetical protein